MCVMILGVDYGVGPAVLADGDVTNAIDLSCAKALRSITAICEASRLSRSICLLLHEILPSLPERHNLSSCVVLAKNYVPGSAYCRLFYDGEWSYYFEDDRRGDTGVTPFADTRFGHDLTDYQLPCDYLAVRVLYPDQCDARIYEVLQPLRDAEIPVKVEYTMRDGVVHEYLPSSE